MTTLEIHQNSVWIKHTLFFSFLNLITCNVHYQEFCQYEMFNASCVGNEVIFIQSARYGRMKIGKCVKNDFGYLGCYSDVTHLMDSICSGRSSCHLTVVDPTFENIHPCNVEFKNYLEVSYECIKVLNPEEHFCDTRKPLPLPNQGYLLHTLSPIQASLCGHAERPYVIRLPPGQKLKIKLLDFNVPSSYEISNNHYIDCDIIYAVVKEPKSGRTEKLCGGKSKTNAKVESNTNIVELHMIERSQDSPKFLLYYEVLGCPDIELPSNTWMRRNGSKAIIGCETSKESWRIHCKGTSWMGKLGNCTLDGKAGLANFRKNSSISLSTGILIIIVVGIACIISFSILLMGIYYLRRQRRQNMCYKNKNNAPIEENYMLTQQNTLKNSPRNCTLLSRRSSCPICSQERELVDGMHCEYAYTWNEGSPQLKDNRVVSNKLYTAGVYSPLPCHCTKIRNYDLKMGEYGNQLDIHNESEPLNNLNSPTNDAFPDSSNSPIFCRLTSHKLSKDPDIIKQDSCLMTTFSSTPNHNTSAYKNDVAPNACSLEEDIFAS